MTSDIRIQCPRVGRLEVKIQDTLIDLFVFTFEPVRDKTNKLDQNIDFCVLVFSDRMGNTLQIGA